MDLAESATASILVITHQLEKGENDGGEALSHQVDNAREDTSLPPVDEGRYAWTFCISACVFETFIWGWNNTYGIFQNYYGAHPPFNTACPAAISVIGTTSFGIQYMELILVIAFFQRYPEHAKSAMWACLVICVIALVISSFATQLWQLIILQGIIFGISAGILYAPMIMWLTDWFVLRRGLAGGIIFGGSGVGGFICPLAMGYLLEAVGFRWTLRIWALVLGVCCGIALLGINPRTPVRKRITVDGPRHPWIPKDLSRLKSPLFFVILGTNVVQALSFFPVSLFIPVYTSSLSSAALPSTLVLALFNATSLASYLIFGRITDSYPYPYVIIGISAGSILAALLLWGFASSLSWVFVFAPIFGGLGGGFPAVWPAAATEIGGSRDEVTSVSVGFFAVAKGTAVIVGPIIAASLHDRSRVAKALYGGFGFLNVEIFVGSMAAATCIGGIALSYLSKSQKKVNI